LPIAPGRVELLSARAHGEIAGADHRIGHLGADGLGEPGDGLLVLAAEMEVGDVKESSHGP
jgi:hypothetical protein